MGGRFWKGAQWWRGRDWWASRGGVRFLYIVSFHDLCWRVVREYGERWGCSFCQAFLHQVATVQSKLLMVHFGLSYDYAEVHDTSSGWGEGWPVPIGCVFFPERKEFFATLGVEKN